MSKFKSARGGINFGAILALAVVAFFIYEGVKFVPVLIAQYQFRDEMDEAAKFSRFKDAQVIKNELVEKARELQLPITLGQVNVSKEPAKTRIQAKYQLSVEWLPGRVYTWQVDEVAESALY